jgi:hypothetical protein
MSVTLQDLPIDPVTEGKLRPLKWLYAKPGIIGNFMILRRTSYPICLCTALLCSGVVLYYRQVNRSSDRAACVLQNKGATSQLRLTF